MTLLLDQHIPQHIPHGGTIVAGDPLPTYERTICPRCGAKTSPYHHDKYCDPCWRTIARTAREKLDGMEPTTRSMHAYIDRLWGSICACAKSLGMTEQTVKSAIDRGFWSDEQLDVVYEALGMTA